MNIKSAAQPHKLELSPVYLAGHIIFSFTNDLIVIRATTHAWNHLCMKKNYASCEVNGKKSQITKLPGRPNFHQFF